MNASRNSTEKLVVIDGNAIMHRAYHALPPLTDPHGNVVNAVYGFFSMLLNLLADQKPDYLAVCFDRGKPTFRQELFVGYHAHRPALSNDFVPQFAMVENILESMNVQLFGIEGYEADDLIGTIATKVQCHPELVSGSSLNQTGVMPKQVRHDKDTIETIIVTGDRDLLQLVDKHTKVLMLVTGLSKTVLFDEQVVEEKYGVHPSQFIDYKALIGDASDGYPGVSGIGPKTAATLLQKYKTFENLYEHVGELSEKQSLQLATDAEQAALAKKLATIVRDVPFQFDVKKCASIDFDIAGLQNEFIKLGSNSLQKRLALAFPDYAEKKKKNIPDGQIELI